MIGIMTSNFKVKPFRSRVYLDAVKELPCCNCGNQADDPHHIKGGYYGEKAPDDMTMPLCRPCHTELHHKGYRAWEELNGHQVDKARETREQLSDLLERLKK